MKLLVISHSQQFKKQLSTQNSLCSSPLKTNSVSKNKSKKSLEVTCKQNHQSKNTLGQQSPPKYHKLMCKTPKQKKSNIQNVIDNLAKTQPKLIHTKKPSLIVKTDLLELYSLSTIDSLQMKRSKVGFLWDSNSPVNKLNEFQ